MADADYAACEQIGQALDAAVAGWLAGRDRDRLIVTLATSDFAPGLAILVRTVRAVSDVPILVLTRDGFEPELDEADVATIDVPPLIRPSHAFPANARHLAVALNKLWLFWLTAPSRVLYLDADCLVLRPIDELFDGDGFAATPDLFLNYTKRGFNAGVFAYSPSAPIPRQLFRLLPKLSVGDGDQGVLNAYFHDWRPLPQGYNFMRAHALLRVQAQDRALRIVHHTPTKPWQDTPGSPRDPVLAPLDELWTARLTPDELAAVGQDWRTRLAAAEASIASWMQNDDALRAEQQRVRRLWRWLIALAALQIPQAGLLAWLIMR